MLSTNKRVINLFTNKDINWQDKNFYHILKMGQLGFE